MKLLTFLFATVPYFLFSQITISNSDFSDGGDVSYVSTASDLTIDFSATGANQNWDYSSLVSTGQVLKEYATLDGASFLVGFTFGDFAGLNYQASNYTASDALPLDQLNQILPVEISDIRQFSKNTNDSITSVGLSITVSGTEIPFKSDTIETRYKFPLNFGDVYDSRGYSNVDMNPVYNGIWRQYRQRHSEVDGWGTITTPFGSFEALRVHHTINESDSLYVDLFGFASWVELPIPVAHQYEWIAAGELEPVLRISTSVIAGNETVTTVEYKDNNLSANLNELTESIRIYPNPVNEVLYIEGVKAKVEYSVYTVAGEKVMDGVFMPGKNSIDIHGVKIGSYLLKVSDEDKLATKVFVKK